MPIKVACQCGQKFTAKDALAGKRVKCPKCSAPITIPAARAGGTPGKSAGSTASPKAQPRSPAGSRVGGAAAGGDSGFGDLLDEVGLSATAGGKRCPNCQAAMKQEAILCVECGYNLQTGRQVRASVGKGTPTAGAPVADVLAKAAQRLEEDKVEERKNVSQGAPWWVLLVTFLAIVGFAGGMMMLPPNVALHGFGIGAMVIGGIVGTVGWIMVIIAAFSISIVQGLLVLTLLYAPIFVGVYWDDVAGKGIVFLGGALLLAFGFGLTFLSTFFAPKNESGFGALDTPPPAAVAVVAAAPGGDVPGSDVRCAAWL